MSKLQAKTTAPHPTETMRHGRSWRWPILPFLAGLTAAGIFLIDLSSSLGIAVAVLYVIVILMAMSFAGRRALVLIAVGCAGLTILAYLLEHGTSYAQQPLLRCLISLATIAIVTWLAVRHRTATQILGNSERRYRNIFQSTGASIWEEDLSAVRRAMDALVEQGIMDIRAHMEASPEFLRHCVSLVRIVDVNEAAVKLVGARDTPHFMASLQNIFIAETEPSFREFLLAFYEGKSSFSYETMIRTIDGERRSILMAATFPVADGAHENVLVSIFDITDRIRAEQALEQARAELAHVGRIITLGELTASIAHEVNQPLAAIVTNGEASLRWLGRPVPDLAEARLCLEELVSEGRRAGDVVHRLRKLATKAAPERALVEVNTLVSEAVELVNRQLLENEVKLTLDLCGGELLVLADRVQLQQVIINLMINATQAMATTRVRDLTIRLRQDPAEGVIVTVQDTGPGIAEEAMDRLFSAFFSTKPSGMGMGLSISRSIIQAHDGQIWATSAQGAGAAFHFALPLARKGEDPAA